MTFAMKVTYLLVLAFASTCLAGAQTLRGFLPSAAQQEAEVETKARAIPEPARMIKYEDFIAGEPHQAGSPRSKAVADYIVGLLKEWGLDTQVETFDVLLPYPTVRKVEVLGPKKYEARLKEPVVPEDPDSGDKNQLPTYNAYGASGDVTGDVVYVNFGLPGDYDYLAKHGIDVKGKIVIARYGQSWRGIKVKVAAQHGAIACLIYSDPHEDGYFEDDIYPAGPMRPWQGVQRGSVMDMPLYSGDPLTPGWAAVPGAKRLSRDEAKVLMKIPVLPLSYGDAQHILEQLTGPVAPESWRGSLPFTYHLGPGATKIHMKTDYDWTLKPIYDVIATIPGSTYPNEWVMVGNHHDAWVNGAEDPVSGTVALLETARTLAAMHQQGWTPKRTLKIAFWDAEEFGLVGSTEWVEKHQDELRQKGVVYMNSDMTARGWLNVSGSHTLEAFLSEVAENITQPGSNESLVQAKLAHEQQQNAKAGKEGAKKKQAFTIGALGAGSDYVPFLDFAGIASTNEEFDGMDHSGIYHSIYDSIYWYNHFSDGRHVYGQALSQFTTTALMRLASADVLPFEFNHFSNTVTGYITSIEKEAVKKHPLTFPEVHKELEALAANSQKYSSALQTALAKNSLNSTKVADLNATLMRTERALTRPEGLPTRSWYKHQIYAPGFYTGYGVKTLPGIREAVEAEQWQLATDEAAKVADCLRRMNELVVKATQDCEGL